jgi:hypothetical protein
MIAAKPGKPVRVAAVARAALPAHVSRPGDRNKGARKPAGPMGRGHGVLSDERRRAAIAPDAAPELLSRSPARMQASSADLAAPPVRPGGEDHLQHPSRVGDRLHYRGGLVTDLQGAVLHAPALARIYRPTHIGQQRTLPVYIDDQ